MNMLKYDTFLTPKRVCSQGIVFKLKILNMKYNGIMDSGSFKEIEEPSWNIPGGFNTFTCMLKT